MKNKILFCIVLFVFVIVFSGFSESKINFYGGGGIATIGALPLIPPIYPGVSMEAFFPILFLQLMSPLIVLLFLTLYTHSRFFLN